MLNFLFTDPATGEVLQCEREPRNAVDRYSLAVTKELLLDIFATKDIHSGCGFECGNDWRVKPHGCWGCSP